MRFNNIDKCLQHYTSVVPNNHFNTIDISKSIQSHFNTSGDMELKVPNDVQNTDTDTNSNTNIDNENINTQEKKNIITMDIIKNKRSDIPTENEYKELLYAFGLCHEANIDYNKFNEIIRKSPLKIRPYCNNKFVQAMRDDNGCVSIEYILKLVYRHIELSRYSLDFMEYSIRSNQRNSMIYIHESELETYFYDLISGHTPSTEIYYSMRDISISQHTQHPLGMINTCLTEEFKRYYIY